MERQTVAVNEFVRRQVMGSGKTFAKDLSFENIASHAEQALEKGNFKPGYRDGVILVPVADSLLHHFYCPFVRIDADSKLSACMTRRRDDEEPYIQIRARSGKLLKTGSADLILYRNDVLAENDEQSTDSDWELIAFQAVPEGIDHMPMGPVTMMRNQLELPGGTRALYTSEEWAHSVRFWQQYAVLDIED